MTTVAASIGEILYSPEALTEATRPRVIAILRESAQLLEYRHANLQHERELPPRAPAKPPSPPRKRGRKPNGAANSNGQASHANLPLPLTTELAGDAQHGSE